MLKKGIYEASVHWVLQHPNHPGLDCWSKAGNCPQQSVPREELAAPHGTSPPDSQLITLTRKVSCWVMVWVHSRGETAHPDHTLPHTTRSAPGAEMHSHGQSQECWHQETNHPREALKAAAIIWYPREQLKPVGCSKAAPTAWFGAFGRAADSLGLLLQPQQPRRGSITVQHTGSGS